MTEPGLRIRVEDRLRQDFIQACKAQDTTAAQVLRAFMRNYVDEYGSFILQGQLFDARSPRPRLAGRGKH